MDNVNEDILRTLMRSCHGMCISLYMPSTPAGLGAREDSVRLKNLLDQAEDMMIERGVRSSDATAMLEPGRRLVDDFLFWRHQDEGLALFLSMDQPFVYRLPLAFDEQVVVGRAYHIRPLLPLLVGEERYYLLTLHADEVRLYRGMRDVLSPVDLGPGLPSSVEEAARIDTHEHQSQFHSASSQERGRYAGGRGYQVWHGTGEDQHAHEDDIKHFFDRIDERVFDIIKHDRAPLVLAGVEYMHPLYREGSRYGNIAEGGILEDPTLLSERDVGKRAMEVLRPHFETAREQAFDKYRAGLGTGHASSDPAEIVAAAAYGRVDTLFVDRRGHVWGSFDAETGEVEFHDEPGPDDTDLLDLAAAHTLMNGGTVFALPAEELPTDSRGAAVFRYAPSGG